MNSNRFRNDVAQRAGYRIPDQEWFAWSAGLTARAQGPKPTVADIERLCDELYEAGGKSGGTAWTGLNDHRLRLIDKGVEFHELCHGQLCAAVVGLSRVLLRPGANTVSDGDHQELWTWCGELLLGQKSPLFPADQYKIKSLYEGCIRAALAQSVDRSTVVLAFLSFPLLEAVLKRACAARLALNGDVIADFDVYDKRGGRVFYSALSKRRNRCNSVRDLLLLHYQLASAELRRLIDRLRDHIAIFDSTQDPFDLIYDWRDQSLYGSANLGTIGGTVLNICLLISLFDIEPGFDRYRETVAAQYRRRIRRQ